MNIEEKAKAYDEVLEKVKGDYIAYKKVGDIAGMDAITSIFPQIAESEDERIRKKMIQWFNEYKEGNPLTICDEEDEEIDSWIAYLEKQKEHIPAEWSDEDEETREEVIGDLCALKDWIIKYDANWLANPVLKNIDKRISWLKFLPKRFNLQPKQEWSEDYWEEYILTRFAFYTYKNEPSVLYLSNVFVEETSRNHGFGTRILMAAERVAETIGAITIRLKVKQDSPANAWYRKHGYGYVTFEDGYDWLEKNLEYLKPQKSVTEWSEEDEKIRQSIIKDIEFERNFTSATTGNVIGKYNEQINWLKDLPERFNLQPKQKWGEEDIDKMVNSRARKSGTTKSEIEFYRQGIKDTLKSLRPSQKLNEEEIKKIRSEEYTKGFNDAVFGGKLKEWSEEDKKRIQRICDFLWKNRKGDTDTIYQIEKDADWLISLPPHPHTISIRNANKFAELEYERGVKDGLNYNWKPTEEQINYLAKAILTLSEEGDNKTANILNELRTQLKLL